MDEIQARHISPMAMHAREVLNHKYFKDTEGGQRQKLEEILTAEKRKAPSKIPYYFSTSKQYPGKFMLGMITFSSESHNLCLIAGHGTCNCFKSPLRILSAIDLK